MGRTHIAATACALVLAALVELSRRYMAFVADLRLMGPEPSGLSERLLAMPRMVLTEEQKIVYERDGVVKIPKVINDRGLLSEIRPMVEKHWIVGGNLPSLWYINGVARAIIRDSTIGELVASAHGSKHSIATDSQVWRKKPGTFYSGPENNTGDIHKDDWPPREVGSSSKLISVWLAITDAPMAMGFFNGSHKFTTYIQDDCNAANFEGERHRYKLNPECVANFTSGQKKGTGDLVYFNMSAEAGDVILFSGDTIHAGITQKGSRVAICLRTYPQGDLPRAKACNPANVETYMPDRQIPLTPRHIRKSHLDCLPYAIAPDLESMSWAPPRDTGEMTFMSHAKLMLSYMAWPKKIGDMAMRQ